MANIPTNYPSGSTDEQIQQTIKELSSEMLSNANANTVMTFSPLIQLGQNELQKRVVEKEAKSSERAERVAVGVAAFSVVLSLIAIWFSYVSYKSDDNWQKEEIQLLKEIGADLKGQ